MRFEEELNTICSYKILGLNMSEYKDKFAFYFPLYRKNEDPDADKNAEWKACCLVIKTFVKDIKDLSGYKMEERNFLNKKHMYVEIIKEKMKHEIFGLYGISRQQFYDCVIIPLMKDLEKILKDRCFKCPIAKYIDNKVDGAVIKPW